MYEIIDANSFMTLATSDARGIPWASPVWFAHRDYREFFWVSRPDARHSRNLAERPELAIVIFDSTVVPLEGEAVYMTATAELTEDGLDVFNKRGAAQGLREWTRADVTEPARHRLYRATASEQWTLGDGDVRIPVARRTA